MLLTKFPVVGLILFTLTWRGGSVVASQSEDDSIVEMLAHILTSCYGDRISGVGLKGNVPDTLARILSTQHMIPVALIDNTLPATNFIPSPEVQFRQQLQVFIVEASSIEQLHNITERGIRPTIWWNHMASFFILDRSPKCNNGIDFLHVVWRLNVLNAKVICYHRFGGRRVIFNFNPYTSQAPSPWKRIGIFRAQNRHPFAAFVRVYQGNKKICVNLDFYKTNNLGGYEISVEGEPLGKKPTSYSKTTLNVYQYWSTIERTLDIIFRSLNARPAFKPLMQFHRITVDIRKNSHLMIKTWNGNKLTYPYSSAGLILISSFRGHKTQLEKILCVVDFASRVGIGIVYIVTLIFLKFFVHQGLWPALLNLVRITCNTGFTNLSNGNAPRTFLTGLLFFVVTVQGIYQGNLAALLTTHVPLRNVDVMQDVIDFNYKLYGESYMETFVKLYPKLEGRFTPLTLQPDDCVTRAKNESSAACLAIAHGSVMDLVQKFELHTSGEFVTTLYGGFEIRWDWPPEQRVNIILSRMVEADVILPWNVKCKPLQLADFKYDTEVKNNKDYKAIELAELAFAFVILGIGLACATIVFIIEVAISPT